MLCPGNMLTKSPYLLQDGISRSGPDERAHFGIVSSHEVLDPGHQLLHAAKGPATDGLLRNDVDPNFDLVEPGGVGRSKVHVTAGVRGQPALDGRMLVHGIVVHDQMDRELLRDVGLDLSEKAQILLMAMAALAPADHGAGSQH